MTSAPLKVLVITEDDPLYVARFFEVFFDEIPKNRIELLGITILRSFHEPIWKTARRIFRFYGPIDFLRLLMRWLRIKLSGRNIELLARNSGIPIFPAMSVNDPEYLERIQALSLDLIVSVAAPEIFRGPLLATARFGCLNIHSGRLPAYRGMMPTFWQMKNGERCVTVTIHQMVEKIDAGGVVTTCEFALQNNDSLDRVITGTKQAGARLMIETLCKIQDQPPESQPLDMTQARYYRFPDPDDVRAFRARGHRML
ncbi:MAG: formyltransferase family protein [Planctomycetota bacterium]|nr:formyltransferase family protein [Planctomycetota bacterium]